MACGPKGRWFEAQSGHTPRLWARSPVRSVREATNCCFSCTSYFSPSLSSSFPLSLKINTKKRNWFVLGTEGWRLETLTKAHRLLFSRSRLSVPVGSGRGMDVGCVATWLPELSGFGDIEANHSPCVVLLRPHRDTGGALDFGCSPGEHKPAPGQEGTR